MMKRLVIDNFRRKDKKCWWNIFWVPFLPLFLGLQSEFVFIALILTDWPMWEGKSAVSDSNAVYMVLRTLPLHRRKIFQYIWIKHAILIPLIVLGVHALLCVIRYGHINYVLGETPRGDSWAYVINIWGPFSRGFFPILLGTAFRFYLFPGGPDAGRTTGKQIAIFLMPLIILLAANWYGKCVPPSLVEVLQVVIAFLCLAMIVFKYGWARMHDWPPTEQSLFHKRPGKKIPAKYMNRPIYRFHRMRETTFPWWNAFKYAFLICVAINAGILIAKYFRSTLFENKNHIDEAERWFLFVIFASGFCGALCLSAGNWFSSLRVWKTLPRSPLWISFALASFVFGISGVFYGVSGGAFYWQGLHGSFLIAVASFLFSCALALVLNAGQFFMRRRLRWGVSFFWAVLIFSCVNLYIYFTQVLKYNLTVFLNDLRYYLAFALIFFLLALWHWHRAIWNCDGGGFYEKAFNARRENQSHE